MLMTPRLFRKKYPGLWKICVGPRYRNMGLFLSILFPNLIAALFEGLSFTLILAGLSVLANDPVSSLSSSLDFFHSWVPFLKTMDRKSLFITLIVLAVVLQGIRSTITGVALYANSLLSLRIQKESQLEIYRKIFSLSYRNVSQYKVGDLAEYTKTPAAMMNVIMDSANRFLVSFFMILATLGVMLFFNVYLACVTLLLLTIIGGLHKSIVRNIGRSSHVLTDGIVDCAKHTIQAIQAIRTVHTYNRQEYVFSRIRKILDGIITASKKVYFWHNFIPSINELFGTLLVTAMLFAGIWILSDHQEGMLPLLITFLVLTHRLAVRIQAANGALGTIMTHKGSILRLEEILKDEGKEFVSQSGKEFSKLNSSICFQRVSLQYPSCQEFAVQEMSFEIPQGKTVAFVGASGAGKSTILDLLLRLYEPTNGAIYINGTDLREYSLGSCRDRLGVVSQDISIFNDTIEENIRFGFQIKAWSEISHAAQLAGLEDFIKTLPGGYQTVVGERGFRLSGGQRQRLALARALLRNPEVLLLDEATSSLDSHAESLIQNALETLRIDRTILVVAHRLSTIVNADYIYVLDEGKIVEEGKHWTLLEKRGIYSRFWELQAESRAQGSPTFQAESV